MKFSRHLFPFILCLSMVIIAVMSYAKLGCSPATQTSEFITSDTIEIRLYNDNTLEIWNKDIDTVFVKKGIDNTRIVVIYKSK